MNTSLQSIIYHFGEMGSRWGFNRTVGQMLGLVVLTEQPLSAEQISEQLSVSRGNVSMAAKELQSWQLIRVHREPGDRKDYYTSNGTIWQLAQQVMAERSKREVNPTLSVMRSQLIDQESHRTGDDSALSPYALQQIREVHDLLELFTLWFADVQNMKQEHIRALMKMGSGVGKVLDFKDRLLPGAEERK